MNRKEFIRLCLFNIRERMAGQMKDENGKDISWDSAVQLIGVPWEDTNGATRKYTIDPEYVDEISKELERVHWGCVVDVSLHQRKVVSLEIVEDVMAPIYMKEPLSLD